MEPDRRHESSPPYDVIIIGAGVSGLSAAIYCGRLELKTVIIGDAPGGTLTLATDVANYPGFKMISGLELAQKIREHAEDYRTEFLEGKVTRIKKCAEGCFRVYAGEKQFHGKTIIYASGTEWRKLGVEGEERLKGRGVHYCALCDGPFYKGKTVTVVGGSDSAVKEALLLAQYAEKVHIIYRGRKLRAEPANMRLLSFNNKVEVLTRTRVLEILGGSHVEGLELDHDLNGKGVFRTDAVFIDVGHNPLSHLAQDIGVELNDRAEVVIDKESRTNIPGFFAAGDVCDTKFKQAITGVGEAVKAAYSAFHFINNTELICVINDEEPEERPE